MIFLTYHYDICKQTNCILQANDLKQQHKIELIKELVMRVMRLLFVVVSMFAFVSCGDEFKEVREIREVREVRDSKRNCEVFVECQEVDGCLQNCKDIVVCDDDQQELSR